MDAQALHDAGRARPDRNLAALALLPLVLLALDSDWIFSGPHRDAWIYYGYFENGIAYLRSFPDLYYASRLAVILPGFVLQHLLPGVAANVLLHLAVYWSAVLSFYLVVRDLFGSRVALLAGLALGCHPYFLQAAGWNYVDGFGIAYFLMALMFLTRAMASPISPSWRPLLLAAGAMVTAIVSTNVFYAAVYMPLLAGHFLLLNRRRIPLLAATLWAVAGAAGLLALFEIAFRAAGGSSFYLSSSLQFLSGSVGTANPFRNPSYTWLRVAVWLVFPAATLLGTIFLLGRKDRILLWSQLQLVLLASMMLYFQIFGDTGVLQNFYYSSLLLPAAFLAFAGQLAPLVEGLPLRRFGALAAGLALIQIFPLLAPKIAVLASAPALFALLAALGAVSGAILAARWRTGGARAVIVVFLCLAVSQLLVRQAGSIFWQFERHEWDGHGLYSQMDHAVRAIDAFDSSRALRLWYDDGAEDGLVYDALASAFLLCPRMVNFNFPDLQTPRMCDGVHLVPGMQIAVLSADPSAFEKAAAALRAIGLSSRRLKREEIPGPSRGFAITYLRCEAWVTP
ncbi:MAG: hypothetical protein QOH06_624 [Acidobacteriota bacterium]|jgi:hypothetical protein|nr:hypothetical protein [Acidobacteriota bacterium]